MTDGQLEAAIETIQAMLAAKEAGAGAKGEALPALPPPPESKPICTVSTHDGVVRQQREEHARPMAGPPPPPRRESRVFIKAPSPSPRPFFTQGR